MFGANASIARRLAAAAILGALVAYNLTQAQLQAGQAQVAQSPPAQ